jgi:pimeloyl-ACP methyl ester carboxylesterase
MNRLAKGFLTSAVVLGTMTAYNVAARRSVRPLTNPLEGKERSYLWKWGPIHYTVAGDGPPVVLVHGIHAAASSYEMRELFGPLTATHCSYAPDLLGFGLSARPGLQYTGALYVELLTDFLKEVVQQPCALVASSLSAAYAIEVAHRLPQQVTHLVLLCPTGLEALVDPPGARGLALHLLLRAPVTGEFLFNLLVSRPSLRYYLTRRVYYDESLVTDEVVEAYYATSHQINARYAPAAFIGGLLNWDARTAYAALSQPVLVIWGRQAIETPVAQADAFMRMNPRARLEVLDRCRLLPHVEHGEKVTCLVLDHLAGTARAPSA